MSRILVTGGCGFIGHHLVEYLLSKSYEIVSLDRLDKAGTLHRHHYLRERYPKQLTFVYHDLRAEINEHVANRIGKVSHIYHLAASSHVLRSIDDPMCFVMDNVVGTCNLLNYARTLEDLHKFLMFSTDEVFGPLHDHVPFKEWDRYNSGNTYAATKCGAEELCLAYHNTYGIPIVITHCTNVFGERQHPEKFIPMTVKKILSGEPVRAHAMLDFHTKSLLPGSRFYIHAKNVAHATHLVMKKGVIGDKYNIPGQQEIDNVAMIERISNILKIRPVLQVVDVYTDRPGGDFNYALDGEKLMAMGCFYPEDFSVGLVRTVRFTRDNTEWMS